MGDAMREKVAVAIWNVLGQDPRFNISPWNDLSDCDKEISVARAGAALEAGHFEELVAALKELHDAVPPCPSGLMVHFPKEAERLIAAKGKAGAVLAKVEGQ